MTPEAIPRLCARSLPLAACILATFALPRADAEPAARRIADTLPVTSCADDGGAGTLRSVVAGAASGDTVDMTQLTCGTITLASGAIPIPIDALTLAGPGADLLTIDGANADRVVTHGGHGALTISGVTLAHGHNETDASLGGCLYSAGNTYLTATTLAACSTAGGSAFFAGGGALVVNGTLTLVDSTLRDNVATRTGSGNYLVIGGAAIVSGNVTVVDSTISGNSVVGFAGTSGYHAYGGGLVAFGPVTLRNSTIAFNAAGRGGGGIFDAGYAIEAQSSIVANNVATYDGYFSADIGGYGTMTGASNLIVDSDIIVPPDTLSDDPALLPLAANGGPTATHALGADSPAIDTGNNASSLPFDQRGAGFLRVSGLAADIGAFEYQQTFAVPTLAKSFTPATIAVQDTSLLTITLTNANALAATLTADLVDPLPAPTVVADPSDATTDCPAGTVIADAGASSVTLASRAAIPADGSCTITVSVRSDTAGTFTNTIPGGSLQTDQGADASAASADLAITAIAPALAKSFAPDHVVAGDASTLTITLTNTNPVAATLTADLADHLPPPLTIASTSTPSTTCPGGVLDATSGAATVTLAAGAAIPANGTCTITLDVATLVPGVFTNTIPAGALASTLGTNATAASADLTVAEGITDRIFADGFDGAAPAPPQGFRE